MFLGINNQIKDAGFYDLFLNEGENLDKYAFNYNRKESILEYYNKEDLKNYVGEYVNVIDTNESAILTAKIEERSQGVILWRWCLILALIFLALEILLLRFWKT